jgi:hypothetical protein
MELKEYVLDQSLIRTEQYWNTRTSCVNKTIHKNLQLLKLVEHNETSADLEPG